MRGFPPFVPIDWQELHQTKDLLYLILPVLALIQSKRLTQFVTPIDGVNVLFCSEHLSIVSLHHWVGLPLDIGVIAKLCSIQPS